VAISDVVADSPAAKAGLKRSDIIVKVNGRVVDSQFALRLNVSQLVPGTEVDVTVIRDGKERNVKVKLGSLDEQTREFIPGVTVKPVDEEVRNQFNLDKRIESGIVITEINENSPYADILVPGVVILEINRIPVTDVRTAADAIKSGLNVLLVKYRGVSRLVPITVK
jgi:S1-C subfamily serine protease